MTEFDENTVRFLKNYLGTLEIKADKVVGDAVMERYYVFKIKELKDQISEIEGEG